MGKGNFIDGQWVVGHGEALISINPSNAATEWQGNAADADDVDQAYRAARAAFGVWSSLSFEERLEPIRRFKDLALANKERIGEMIARETGKVLWDATGEAGAVAAKVDISIRSYDERTGQASTPTAFGRAELRHRAHGVMAILGPYNFPAHLPNGQIIPALIAGNTIVYKPSELCPAVAELMMSLYVEAGFPPGVINMVQGGRTVGAALLDHDDLNGVLFTGSPGTGKFIHKKFGGRPEIILALEMGGNNPLLIWDSEQIMRTANIAVQSAFISSGQRCTCARRVLVPHGKVGDAMIDGMLALVDSLKIGPWDAEPSPFMGPVVSAHIAENICKQFGALNGTVLRAPRILDAGPAFVSPAIIDVTGQQNPDEEIFGPVMQIVRIDDFEQGLHIANDTKYGLSAGLVSDNLGLWPEFVAKIRAGVVNFNRLTPGASSAMPFGGPGQSGNNRPGAYYAADFCAWPMASQIADAVEPIAAHGINSDLVS